MSKPKTFEFQDQLPRLPIPSLDNLAVIYMQSVKPLSTPDTLKTTEAHLIDFIKPGGLGVELQKRLRAHDKNQPNSWLEDWWLEYAYHRYREPSLINVNWYCLGGDEPNLPKDIGELPGGFSQYQLTRAAHLISGFLDYWQKVEREEIAVQFVGKSPTCMNQYKYMFNTSRIPQPECDKLVNMFPTKARHIIVMCKNQPFMVPVHYSDEKLMSTGDILRQLQSVIEEARQTTGSDVGLLTAGHRDIWATAREKILRVHSSNLKSLQYIESAIFAVSLDDYYVPQNLNARKNNIFHGQLANNRWADATLNLIVDQSGASGVNGEHSPLDALVAASVFEHALNINLDVDQFHPTSTQLPKTVRLAFKVDEGIKKLINDAKLSIKKVIDDSDSKVFVFSGHGVDFIKKIAKTSPDAYLQMALQLAHYKLHKKCVSTYESGSTRKFKHGRTDVIRTLSTASAKFCEMMEDPKVSYEAKYAQMQDAVKNHLSYGQMVSSGQAIDRHLLGLKLCMKPTESHPLFSDPVFTESSTWSLSTSTFFRSDRIVGTGFGCVHPDGYGINYMPSLDGAKVTFGIESKHSSTISSTDGFAASLQAALMAMMEMCDKVDHTKVKLASATKPSL